MKNLSNYIQRLKFDYAISYSGLRVETYINLKIGNRVAIQKIEQEINIYNTRIIK